MRAGFRGGRPGGTRPRVQKKGSARPLVPLASASSSSQDSTYGSGDGDGDGGGEGEEDAFGDGGYAGHVVHAGLGGGVGLGLELGPRVGEMGEMRHARAGGGGDEEDADGFAFVHGSAREEARLTQVLLRTLEEAGAGAAGGGGERRR